MNSKAVKLAGFAFAAAAIVIVILLCGREKGGDAVGSAQDAEEPAPQTAKTSEVVRERPAKAVTAGPAAEAPAEDDGEQEEPKTEEELREAEEEKNVEAFDGLVDKWMEKEGGEVTMKDVDEFVALFRSVPTSRREECLQRALNLVSDDHVLLLAGVLFDKTADKEHVELVFNDVLNRDESVKKLILPMIYKDKTHPCWADTAWILDVTGETPTNTTKEKTE